MGWGQSGVARSDRTISFNVALRLKSCVFFSKTPENDNLIASSTELCSPDCNVRLIYSGTRMDITSGRPVCRINLRPPFLRRVGIKKRKWRREEPATSRHQYQPQCIIAPSTLLVFIWHATYFIKTISRVVRWDLFLEVQPVSENVF